MTTYVRYSPFSTMFNRAIARQLARPYYAPAAPAVAVNVKEDETAFHLEVAAPGLDKTEFKINVVGNTLTVSHHHEGTDAENAGTFTRQEFATNNFERSFRLPKNVNADQIQATYTDGILKLDLPKVAEKAIESKVITIA